MLFTEDDPLLDRTYQALFNLGRASDSYIGLDAELALLRNGGVTDARLPWTEAQLAKAKRRYHRRVAEFVKAARPELRHSDSVSLSDP